MSPLAFRTRRRQPVGPASAALAGPPAAIPLMMARPAGGTAAQRVAVALSTLSLLLSAGALAVALARPEPEPMPPPPAATRPGLIALAGAELLLPHLARSAPFPRALAVATTLAEAEPLIAETLRPLAGIAELGAPLPRQLAEGFAEAADHAVLAEMGYGPEAGGLARLMASTMRFGARLGSAGTPALAATAMAELRLGRGDLAGAAAALDGLDGPVAERVEPWRQAVARRLATDAAAARLTALLAARTAMEPADAREPAEARLARRSGTTEAGR